MTWPGIGVAARRVMRRLNLGGPYSRVARWVDGLRPVVAPSDWSAPLISVRHRSTQLPDVWAGSAEPSDPASREVTVTVKSSPAQKEPSLRCLLAAATLDIGGVEEVVAFLARRLPALGVQTAILCTRPEGSASGQLPGRVARALQSEGIEVCAVSGGKELDWVRGWRPDVISGHGDPVWAADAARRAGIPYVDNLHSMNGVIGRDWSWQGEAARSGYLAAVIAVSDVLRQQYLATNPGFPADRIVTIPNGVDEFRKRGDRAATRDWLGIKDEYLLVSLCRYCMQKNIYGLIAAFGDVARTHPEVQLVVAGNVDEPLYYRRLHQLREGMPHREQVHLRDHCRQPADLLAAADGFVLDSFFEGWPLASMEALCAGVPVVMADVSGAREQIGNDLRRGYVVANPLGDSLVDWSACSAAKYRPQANREELAAAIERLVSERARYQRDRQRLAAESAARFSAARWAERHAAVLRAAASSRPENLAAHSVGVGGD